MSSTEPTAGAAGLTFVIDSDLCAGHGRCYTLDPGHFEADDVGYGQVLDKVEPLSQRAAMEDVAMACPEAAISIREVPAAD